MRCISLALVGRNDFFGVYGYTSKRFVSITYSCVDACARMSEHECVCVCVCAWCIFFFLTKSLLLLIGTNKFLFDTLNVNIARVLRKIDNNNGNGTLKITENEQRVNHILLVMILVSQLQISTAYS